MIKLICLDCVLSLNLKYPKHMLDWNKGICGVCLMKCMVAKMKEFKK